jgi:hypothetical protein
LDFIPGKVRVALKKKKTVAVCAGAALGYEITSQTTPDEFPVQVPNYFNERSFFRVYNGTKIEIECPWGYVFDRKEMFCVKDNSPTHHRLDGCRVNLGDGVWPNPDSCYTYFLCGNECCTLKPCPSQLLFSASALTCDFPKQANCCEYREKNPDRLVQ